MKKLLLGLGTLAAVAAPVATVIACGDQSSKKSNDDVLAKALEATKEGEITLVQNSSMSDANQKDAIAKIKTFKTIKGVQEFFNTLTLTPKVVTPKISSPKVEEPKVQSFDFSANDKSSWHKLVNVDFAEGDSIKINDITHTLTSDDVTKIGVNPGDMSKAGDWMLNIIKVVFGDKLADDVKTKALAYATASEAALEAAGTPSTVLQEYITSLTPPPAKAAGISGADKQAALDAFAASGDLHSSILIGDPISSSAKVISSAVKGDDIIVTYQSTETHSATKVGLFARYTIDVKQKKVTKVETSVDGVTYAELGDSVIAGCNGWTGGTVKAIDEYLKAIGDVK